MAVAVWLWGCGGGSGFVAVAVAVWLWLWLLQWLCGCYCSGVAGACVHANTSGGVARAPPYRLRPRLPPGRRYDEELLEHQSRKERARAGPKATFPEPDPVQCPNDARAEAHNAHFGKPRDRCVLRTARWCVHPPIPPSTARVVARVCRHAHSLLSMRLKTVENCPSLRRMLETPFGLAPKRRKTDPDYKETFLTHLQQKRRNFLGPYINHGFDGLRLLGRRSLQTTGVVLYPVRLVRVSVIGWAEWGRGSTPLRGSW